jgi:ankyrin repeat domain-containing protein 50
MLIAKLHLETISRQDTIRQVKNTLANLTPDLDAMYGQNVARIPGKDRRLAFDVFSWIALAPTPLSMEELRHAIATDPDDENICVITEDDLPLPKKILQACVGLVNVRKAWSWSDREEIVLVRMSYSF